MYLASIEDMELQVIHLVRDCRGVVYSEERKGNCWIKSYLRWLLTNILYSRSAKKYTKEENFMRLSYDQFAQAPERYLSAINKRFGLAVDTNDYITNAAQKQLHAFAGNRLLGQKIESIKYDQNWKLGMAPWKRITLNLLGYLPNRIWVYRSSEVKHV